MKHIILLAVMGMMAAMLAGMWTRLIRKGMILECLRNYLNNLTKEKIMKAGRFEYAFWDKLLSCTFCLTPYIALALDACYIVIYTPAWYLCVIGVFVSLGAGNFIAEIIYDIRRDYEEM